MTRVFAARRCAVVVAALGALSPTSAFAAPDPVALMNKWDQVQLIPEEQTDVVWVLQAEGGKERLRETEVLRIQDRKGGDKSLFRFVGPADVKGVTSVYHENLGGEDDQWVYLPAFKKLRRVGTSQLGDRFSDTDLFFQDLRRIVPADYALKLKGEEKFESDACWVIEGVPKRADNPYGKSIFWLRKDTLVIVRMQLYDKNNRPMKEVTYRKLQKVTGTAWRADETQIVDVQRRHRTVLVVKKRKVNPGFGEATFDPQRLGQ